MAAYFMAEPPRVLKDGKLVRGWKIIGREGNPEVHTTASRVWIKPANGPAALIDDAIVMQWDGGEGYPDELDAFEEREKQKARRDSPKGIWIECDTCKRWRLVANRKRKHTWFCHGDKTMAWNLTCYAPQEPWDPEEYDWDLVANEPRKTPITTAQPDAAPAQPDAAPAVQPDAAPAPPDAAPVAQQDAAPAAQPDTAPAVQEVADDAAQGAAQDDAEEPEILEYDGVGELEGLEEDGLEGLDI